MRIPIDKVVPNPFRNFELDPIDQQQVDRLAASIDDLGFFSGVTARHVGTVYQLACGHHRKEAAKKAGLTHIEAVVDTYTDNEMRRIMAIENLTQRGGSGGAMLDAVAAFAYQVSYEVLTDRLPEKIFSGKPLNAVRGSVLKDGPGTRLIYQAINGFHYDEHKDRKAGDEKAVLAEIGPVRSAVAALKDSGEMAKIVERAFLVVEQERVEDAEKAAEAERKAQAKRDAEEQEKRRKEHEATLKAEREAEEARKAEEKAARDKANAEEQEKLRKEREAAEKEAQKKADEEKAAQAERDAEEAERKAKVKKEADEKAKKEAEERRKVKEQQELERVYNIGCNQLFEKAGFDTDYSEAFRKSITSVGARELFPKNQQYDIAKTVIAGMQQSKDVTGNRPGVAYVGNFISGLIQEHDEAERKLNEEEEARRRLERENMSQRLLADKLWTQVYGATYKAEETIKKLLDLNQKWDKRFGDFPVSNAINLANLLGITERIEEMVLKMFPNDPAVASWRRGMEEQWGGHSDEPKQIGLGRRQS